MKTITLCAGVGSRLRPETNFVPKCLVKFDGKPILLRQLDSFRSCGLTKNYIVSGYLHDTIDVDVSKFHNENFANTNMVYSLALASEIFDQTEDVLMAYGDIIFDEGILKKIRTSTDEITVVADRNWKDYWQERLTDYWFDVESFATDENGYLKSIGQEWNVQSEIEAQYIGLIKFPKSVHKTIKNKLKTVLENVNLQNIYMTDFLQDLIDDGMKLRPMYIKSGWLEFDQPSDLDTKFLKFLNNYSD